MAPAYLQMWEAAGIKQLKHGKRFHLRAEVHAVYLASAKGRRGPTPVAPASPCRRSACARRAD
jgi:hypothetical protein